MIIKDLIELSRPRHWVKNVFVFMPVPFALAAGATLDPWRFVLGLLGFCLANSAVYSFNDAHDAERDRQHPKKRERPVASGRISEGLAWAWSAGLALAGFALVWLSGSLHGGGSLYSVGSLSAEGSSQAVAILVIYLVLNAYYSVHGKHVALVDVFLLASGFVLRVLLGTALVGVPPSNWLLLCSSTLALLLALGKRRGDLVKGLDESHRPSLAGYSRPFLDHATAIMAAVTIVSYALYCVEADILLAGRELATLPFVLFGVLEYLRLVHVRDEGGSPVDLLLSSPTLLLCGVGWVAATVWSVPLPW